MNVTNRYIYERFPESLFSAENPLDYCKTLSVGLNKSLSSNVAIVGICRNISQVLDHAVARMYKTASLFNDYCFIIYENDSNDGTSSRLKEYASQDDNFVLLQETLGRNQFTNTRDYNRAVYLSGIRNKYLSTLKDIPNIDYVIVVDLDLEGGWSYDGILNSLSHKGWSAMTSNGLLFREKTVTVKGSESNQSFSEMESIFFDTWAFRGLGDKYPLKDGELHSKSFFRGEEPVKVFSNFGGMAIYKYDDIVRCEYGATRHDNGSVDCDHPFLHQQIRDNGGSVYLNPSMVTLYSPHEFSFSVT